MKTPPIIIKTFLKKSAKPSTLWSSVLKNHENSLKYSKPVFRILIAPDLTFQNIRIFAKQIILLSFLLEKCFAEILYSTLKLIRELKC
jgi:hypothetical protein